MAIPVLGQTDFSPLFRSQATALESQRYASEGFVNLGKQISASIQLNNARKEADEAAPFLANAYQSGLDSILNGRIPEGLSAIYAANARFGDNPILAPSLEAMNKTAGVLTNSVLQQSQMAQEFGYRQAMQEDEQDFRRERPMNEMQKMKMLDSLNKRADTLFENMASERDPEKYQTYLAQWNQTRDALINLGQPVFDEGSAPAYIDEESIAEITDIDKKIEEYTKEIKNNNVRQGPDWGWGKEFKDLIKDLKSRKDIIINRAKKHISNPATKEIQRTSPSPNIVNDQTDYIEGPLPTDSSSPGIDLTQPVTDVAMPQTGYIAGRRYGGMTYVGGDPNQESSWSQ